jgi:hypothetical protein
MRGNRGKKNPQRWMAAILVLAMGISSAGALMQKPD